VPGRFGPERSIAVDDLAAFVRAQYERDLDLAGVEAGEGARRALVTMPAPQAVLADLQGRLDAALIEVGRYRALTEQAGQASAHVEELLKERIAELQSELTTARQEADRLRSRSWLARLFGGAG
jgi:hypothetical protein